MIGRRKSVVAAVVVCVASPLAAFAQQAAKTPRVGILLPALSDPNVAAFEEALRALGWVDGKTILLERRSVEGHPERYPALAAELVRFKVDVILAAGARPSLDAARDATQTIPIVMVASSRDPVRDGLVKSFARPSGNITGIVTIPAEGGGKLLELLKESVPSISRVGVIWDATLGPYRESQELRATARSLGIELVGLEGREPADFDRAIVDAAKVPMGGLIVISTPVTGRYRKEIADVIRMHRLPSISLFRGQAEAGLLMTYGPSLRDEFRSAAAYVDKILKGAHPGDLPVEQPTKFELVINLKTAKALGITIPKSMLIRADEVIE